MEIAGSDGSKLGINPGQIREFGRGNGLNSSDKTISRRQIAFFVPQFGDSQEIRVQFEVLGRNPIYVSRNGEVKIFRKFERGEMENGDMFCVSAKDPTWYTFKGVEACSESVRENDLAGDLDSGYDEIKGVEDFQQGDVDISCIDPVAEFGFLVKGSEFDLYPKKMIRDFKNWDWFLEEARRYSDDDGDDGKKGKKRSIKKRKKGAENEDEDWTGESEDEKVLINKPKNAQRPKYATRSKGHHRGTQSKANTMKTRKVDDEDEDEDDEYDETLGGFIVDDSNLDEDEDIGDEDEEEFEDEDEE